LICYVSSVPNNYGVVRLWRSDTFLDLDLNTGVCTTLSVNPLPPRGSYSSIKTQDGLYVYTLTREFNGSADLVLRAYELKSAACVTTVKLSKDPNTPNSTPTFTLAYEKRETNGFIYAVQLNRGFGVYTFDLYSIDPRTGVVTLINRNFACLFTTARLIQLDSEQILWTYKQGCNLLTNFESFNSTTGKSLQSYGTGDQKIRVIITDRASKYSYALIQDYRYSNYPTLPMKSRTAPFTGHMFEDLSDKPWFIPGFNPKLSGLLGWPVQNEFDPLPFKEVITIYRVGDSNTAVLKFVDILSGKLVRNQTLDSSCPKDLYLNSGSV